MGDIEINEWNKVSEHYQEMPQSHTADRPAAT